MFDIFFGINSQEQNFQVIVYMHSQFAYLMSDSSSELPLHETSCIPASLTTLSIIQLSNFANVILLI